MDNIKNGIHRPFVSCQERYQIERNTINVMPAFVLVLTQIDKFLPLYKRKKAWQEQRPPPVVFEMFPSSGVLSPGERVNVHIKFKPADGVNCF